MMAESELGLEQAAEIARRAPMKRELGPGENEIVEFRLPVLLAMYPLSEDEERCRRVWARALRLNGGVNSDLFPSLPSSEFRSIVETALTEDTHEKVLKVWVQYIGASDDA